ncbi:transport protein particle component [Haematococcus lacustris]
MAGQQGLPPPRIAQPPHAAPQPLPAQRRCAEVVLDLCVGEVVTMFANQGPQAASAALDAIGFRVGRQLVERLTKDRPRLSDTLDIMKFICKDFWVAVFKKQIDNLRTNHRGVYVLQDNNCRWLTKLVPFADDEGTQRLAASYLHLPSGIIRGAVSHLGLSCSVEAEVKALPAATFTIKLA